MKVTVRGLKRAFIPFLFWLSISVVQNAKAQDLDLLFSSLMNFHKLDVITLEELTDHPLQINSLFTYNDFYRKQVNSVPVLEFSGEVWEISGFVPLPWNRFQSATSFSFSRSQRWFENTRDRTSLFVEDTAEMTGFSMQLAFTDGSFLFGAGFTLHLSDSHTPVYVKGFPTSKSRTMLSFFLDWIEPTFGRQLDIREETQSQKPFVFGSMPISRKLRLGLWATHSTSRLTPKMSYANSSNRSELNGNREIDIPSRFKENIIELAISNKETKSKISTTLFDSEFRFNVDNNPPQTFPVLLDFEELGGGEGSRSGFAIKYLKEWGDRFIKIGVGAGSYSGNLDVNTPVLGYYANAFPISHGVKAGIRGKSFSQLIEAGFLRTLFSIESLLSVGYSHGFFDFKIDGDALMEFNLVSVPIHHPLQYHVYVVNLDWQLHRRLGPVVARYSFSQFIPFVVRSDTSPIHLSEKVEGVRTKSRGGGVHQLVFSFQL